MKFLLTIAVCFCASPVLAADEPLHTRIDKLIEAKANGVISPAAVDAEFLRRVYLDLAGRIPTSAESLVFIADKKTERHENLIKKLLSGPDYPRRMQELFHVMLMERRGENADWTKFLRAAFEQNKPWHLMARAILKPNADSEELRGAAFFVTQRLVKEGAMAPVDVPGLTRDVGRIFAGVDLQCAQCHDHLTIEYYHQQHFQGLHMIFENVQTRRDVKFPAVAENVMKAKKEFKSVFEQIALQTGPVIPGGSEVKIPEFKKGEEFAVAPDRKKRTPGIPKFSPLNELANGLAAKENRLFAKNIANRLWFVMMGRGLVEPLDLQHADNPPSHPKLLELLATEFANHDFDIRWMLGEIARTKTYQRSSVVVKNSKSDEPPPVESYAVAVEKRVSAEQLFWSLGIATGEFEAVRSELLAGAEDGKTTQLESIKNATLEELVAKSDELKEAFKNVQSNFGNAPKEPEIEFTPTVKGALYLMHEEQFQRWLKPRSGNLTEKLSIQKDNASVVDELFLAVLSRRPSDEESSQMQGLLEKNKDRRSDFIQNLVWAMLTSTEFVVNH
jgi:hypothetical protein